MTQKNNLRLEIYRKTFHLSSLWMVLAIYFLDKSQAILLFSVLTLVVFLTEFLRKKINFIAKIYQQIFGKILRDHEQNGSFSGAFFMLLSCLICLILFSKTIAMVSLAVTLVSDSMAAIIGKKFGKHRLFDKSIEGSLAFFISAILVISCFYNFSQNLLAIIISAFLATITELFAKKIKIDDNLTITLITATSLIVLI